MHQHQSIELPKEKREFSLAAVLGLYHGDVYFGGESATEINDLAEFMAGRPVKLADDEALHPKLKQVLDERFLELRRLPWQKFNAMLSIAEKQGQEAVDVVVETFLADAAATFHTEKMLVVAGCAS